MRFLLRFFCFDRTDESGPVVCRPGIPLMLFSLVFSLSLSFRFEENEHAKDNLWDEPRTQEFRQGRLELARRRRSPNDLVYSKGIDHHSSDLSALIAYFLLLLNKKLVAEAFIGPHFSHVQTDTSLVPSSPTSGTHHEASKWRLLQGQQNRINGPAYQAWELCHRVEEGADIRRSCQFRQLQGTCLYKPTLNIF